MEDCSIVRDGSRERSVAKGAVCPDTTHVRLAVERSHWTQVLATRQQSSTRYDGEMPDNDWWTNVTTLKWTRWHTGSQDSWRKHRRYMVEVSSNGHQMGSGVLNQLQIVHQSFWDAKDWLIDWLSSVLRPRQHSIGYMGDGDAKEQRVAVVRATGNERLD